MQVMGPGPGSGLEGVRGGIRSRPVGRSPMEVVLVVVEAGDLNGVGGPPTSEVLRVVPRAASIVGEPVEGDF